MILDLLLELIKIVWWVIRTFWWVWVILLGIELFKIGVDYLNNWLQKRKVKKWLEEHKTLEEWKKLNSGGQFEKVTAAIFEKLGYKTKIKRNGGVDIVARKDGKQFLIQCKKMEKVKPDDVRAFWGSIQARVDRGDIKKAFFVTTGSFTKGSMGFVKNIPNRPIELIDGIKLEKLAKS